MNVARSYSFKIYKSMTIDQLQSELTKAAQILGGDTKVFVKGYDDVRQDAFLIEVTAA